MLLLALGAFASLQTPHGVGRPAQVAVTTLASPAAVGEDPTLVRVAAQSLLLRAAFSGLPFQGSVTADVRLSSAGAIPRLAPFFVRPSALSVEPPVAPRAGVLGVLWAAYDRAARSVPARCHLPTTLLAAIGQVESGSLAGRSLDARHVVVPPVLGPVLSGGGVAAIRDTDGGRWDGNPIWDRAVGPMQFIPGTWRIWGSDGNADGVADPQNVEDAAYSAARYLCAGGRDLSQPSDLRAAILSYNHSSTYLATVLALMRTIGPGSMPVLPSVPAADLPSGASAVPAAPAPSTTPPTTTDTTTDTTTSPSTTTPGTSPAPSQTTSEPSTSQPSTSDPTTTTTTAVSPSTTSTTSDPTISSSTTAAESGTPVPPSTP